MTNNSERPNRRLDWRAILVGFAVDFVATNVAGGVVGTVIGVMAAVQGRPREALLTLVFERPVLVLGMSLGLGCTFLAGLITALMARHDPLINAAALGLISLAYGVLFLPVFFLTQAGRDQLPLAAIFSLTTPLVAGLGGCLALPFRLLRRT